MSKIKLVVEIDERIIEYIKEKDLPLGMIDDLCRAVENGTPIAEGDMISREHLQNLTCGIIDEEGIIHQVVMLADIDNAPSIGGKQND